MSAYRKQKLTSCKTIQKEGISYENGNWGGWSVSRPVKQSSVLQDTTDFAKGIRQEKLIERQKAEQELKEYFGNRFIGFYVKWLEEEVKREEIVEAEEIKNTGEEESQTISGSVGVNVRKTARKIAAAKTKEQLMMVISEIKNDIEQLEEKWLESKEAKDDIVSANSIEKLIKKVEEYNYSYMADNVKTDSEKYVGAVIDFKG